MRTNFFINKTIYYFRIKHLEQLITRSVAVFIIFISSAIHQLCAQSLATVELKAVTENLPPYQIVKNNTLVGGTSYLIVKELFKRSGYQVKFELLPWARAYSVALSEPNVVIFSMTRSNRREDKFKWIGELRELTYSFYSKKSDATLVVSSARDVQQYTVVAVRNSFEAQSLIRQGFIVDENLVLAKDYEQAWKMLNRGRVDFTYANELIGDNVFKSLGFKSSPFFKQPFEVEVNSLYIAASLQTDDEIFEKLKQALTSIKNDGTFFSINAQQPDLAF